jgi:hypothetical protein
VMAKTTIAIEQLQQMTTMTKSITVLSKPVTMALSQFIAKKFENLLAKSRNMVIS